MVDAHRRNKIRGHIIRERSTGIMNGYENHQEARGETHSSLYEGYAIGGPRDKIKISAPGTWDGRIKTHSRMKDGEELKSYHPGRYKWTIKPTDEFDNTITYTWVWQKQTEMEHPLLP